MVDGGGFSQVAGVPVGPGLVAVLDAMGPRAPYQPMPETRSGPPDPGVRASADEAVERAAAVAACLEEAVGWQRVIAWADSRLNGAILGVVGTQINPDDEDWGREEIAAALRLSGQPAGERVDVARALATRLFLTGDALRKGQITLRHATEIAKALEPLADDALCASVEAKILNGATARTPAQLGRHARAEVIRADPQGADERHRRARRTRRVEFTPLPEGMAELRALLPADGAARLRATIDELAGRVRAKGDDRTIDQRRADALVALGELGLLRRPDATNSTNITLRPPAPESDSPAGNNGVPETDGPGAGNSGAGGTNGPGAGHNGAGGTDGAGAGHNGAGGTNGPGGGNNGAGGTDGAGAGNEAAGAPAARRAARSRVALVAPLSTVLGATNLPGELIGYGPVPPVIVRELAADGHWEKWTTDPSGTITDLGRTTYRPPARLAALIRATYPRCVFPGCSQPSYRCDLDHAVRWIDGGPTNNRNLIPLCRRHHRAKDEGGWRVQQHTDSSCDWTSPAGRSYHIDAPRHLADADTGDGHGEGNEAWTVSEDWTVSLTPAASTGMASPSRTAGPLSGQATVAPGDLLDDPPPF
jgi:hypothetical protein